MHRGSSCQRAAHTCLLPPLPSQVAPQARRPGRDRGFEAGTSGRAVAGRAVAEVLGSRLAPAAPPAHLEPVRPELQPRHVAIIMDGNGRWTTEQGLARHAGHRAGIAALRTAVSCCLQWGIPALTVFAFSEENWQRGREEVAFLLRLLEDALDREVAALSAEGVRLHFLGSRAQLPASLRQAMARTEAATAGNSRLRLTVAVSHGGRQDMAAAAQQLAREVAAGTLSPADVTEAALAERCGLRHLPRELRAPDLLVRTGGQQRLSNFLLWDLAYSELYFTRCRWPEFDEAAFADAVLAFSLRQRNFGT